METTGPGGKGHRSIRHSLELGQQGRYQEVMGEGTQPQAEESQWGDSGCDMPPPFILPELCPSCSQTVQLQVWAWDLSSKLLVSLVDPQAFTCWDCSSASSMKDVTEWGLMAGMTVQPCRLKNWLPGNHGGQ